MNTPIDTAPDWLVTLLDDAGIDMSELTPEEIELLMQLPEPSEPVYHQGLNYNEPLESEYDNRCIIALQPAKENPGSMLATLHSEGYTNAKYFRTARFWVWYID